MRIVTLAVGLALIGVLVRFFVAMPLIEEQVQELAASQQLALASYVARDIDHSVTARLALIQQFANDIPLELIDQPEALKTWIGERQRINPLFNGGLLAIQPDGHSLLAAYPVIGERDHLDFTATDWFVRAVSGSEAVMGKASRGIDGTVPGIVFATSVRNDVGELVLVLAGVVSLNAPGFLDHMQQTHLGSSGGFILVSPADHLFIAASDQSMVLKPTPPVGVNLLHDRAMAGYRGTGVTVNALGVEELSAMVTVPSTGWFVVARMPTAEAFSAVTTMRQFIFKANMLLLITIFIALLVVLPLIVRPLTRVSRAIRDMADGKAELAALRIERNDEVGELVRGFNILVGRLHVEEVARKSSETRLKYLAHHDSLTGLFNRAMLEDRLEHALARAERDKGQIALLFCDLDGFKGINDQHGHDVGDAVLRQVGMRLSEGRRRIDTVARLGGDEFVILLTGLKHARPVADHVAQQCLIAIREPFEIDGKTLNIGVSIGIALHSGAAVTPSYLMAKADIAMYQAKHGGKGNFLFVADADIDEAEPAHVAAPVPVQLDALDALDALEPGMTPVLATPS